MVIYIFKKNQAQFGALVADAIPKATSTLIVLKERVSFFPFYLGQDAYNFKYCFSCYNCDLNIRFLLSF